MRSKVMTRKAAAEQLIRASNTYKQSDNEWHKGIAEGLRRGANLLQNVLTSDTPPCPHCGSKNTVELWDTGAGKLVGFTCLDCADHPIFTEVK